jgi:hypothetical protein
MPFCRPPNRLPTVVTVLRTTNGATTPATAIPRSTNGRVAVMILRRSVKP